MTDGPDFGIGDGEGDPEPPQPPAGGQQSYGDPGGEQPDQQAAEPRRGWPRSAVVVAGLAIAGFVAVGFLFLQASGDRDDAEEALAANERELSQVSSQLDTSKQETVGLQDELGGAKQSLTEAEVKLAEAAETRQGVIDFLATSFTVGSPLTQAQGVCVTEGMLAERSVSELLDAFAGVAVDSPDQDLLSLTSDLLAAADDCDIPLDVLNGPVAFSYGDDAALDALFDQCATGSGSACDQLYLSSPVGSDYESFGATCGGRFSTAEVPETCAGSSLGELVGQTGEPLVSGDVLPQLLTSVGDAAVGLPAPTITGENFAGEAVAIAADGTPTAIVFLAHWCPHCQTEVPRVQAWLNSGGGVDGVEIVSVSTSVSAARANYPPSDWLEREQWSPDVLLDDATGSVHRSFGGGGFPYWVFLNADGTVAARTAGELDIATLEQFLLEIAG